MSFVLIKLILFIYERFMVLKGKTRGTIANVERLLASKKKCTVRYYQAYEIEPCCSSMREVNSETDLQTLLYWMER